MVWYIFWTNGVVTFCI
uniref:Uncharacterized protein n=1 Tax=Anguilla anguilla TaxID=7936 RepID=A0A0E9VJ23_ANGAN